MMRLPFSLGRPAASGAALALLTGLLGWSAAAQPLLTRWAKEVTPTNAHPEYPRPQLVRSAWLNLNGEWDYAITHTADSAPAAYSGKILVPFPIESYLSGVQTNLDERSTLWYHRHFTVPADWRGKRVQLHFGAVDWQTRVYLNGTLLGTHRGGYDNFSFELTRALNWAGDNELSVAVNDPTEGDQPRGKQTRKVEGIFYTPSSGIWQTVWLEPLPEEHIQSLNLLPDLGGSDLRATVMANQLRDDSRVEILVSFAGKEMGRATGLPGTEIRVPLRERHPWSPAQPNLYDVQVSLRRGAAPVDQVGSYFGLREIRVENDPAGARRLFLNGAPLFQMGVLDQGFWPDGLYTAPTDAALRFDLETAKQLGFNLIRKHVKVEPDRWYYWADKLGLLVWQDMPSGNNSGDTSRRQFEMELDRLLDQKANHPSIIMWVIFNEGWGQYDTERLARRVKAVDPTRLVNSASGWTDMKVGDVIDIHSYPVPIAPATESVRAAVLGEFGGLGLGVTSHTWSSRQPWSYLLFPDAERLTEEYEVLLKKLWKLHAANGLAAAVYTQMTDVETECNGFLTYDREVLKMDALRVHRANSDLPKLLPDARDGEVAWAYTTAQPSEDWMNPQSSTEGWQRGVAGFGAPNPPGAVIRTEWKSSDIWLRREFELNVGFQPPTALAIYHDEDAEVYLNGVLALQISGYAMGYRVLPISAEASRALRPGKNVIAVHCHQSSGGQFIDVGIFADPPR
jgi:hypothetical protein